MGPVQRRHRPLHEHESAAGDLAGGGEIQQPQPLAHVHVVAHRERELARHTVTAHFHVVVRRAAHRHRFVGQVGEGEKEIVQAPLHIGEPRF